MPLDDAVGINCKKGRTTENQGSGVKYMGEGIYLDDCVCVLSDLTRHPEFHSQPTTFDHINIKYIWGPHVHCTLYGEPTLMTYRDLQKVYTSNKYHFPIFIYYKETIKKFVNYII